MSAKPIVDLMLGCDGSFSLEEVSQQLVLLGFEKIPKHKPTRFFCKDSPNFGVSVCVVEYQDAYWHTRILFRDYFIDYPEEVINYSNLKKNLIKKHLSFEKYCEGKQTYIYNILLKQGVTKEEAELGNVFTKNPTDMSIPMPVTRQFYMSSRGKTK